jgi:hypothetical protein
MVPCCAHNHVGRDVGPGILGGAAKVDRHAGFAVPVCQAVAGDVAGLHHLNFTAGHESPEMDALAARSDFGGKDGTRRRWDGCVLHDHLRRGRGGAAAVVLSGGQDRACCQRRHHERVAAARCHSHEGDTVNGEHDLGATDEAIDVDLRGAARYPFENCWRQRGHVLRLQHSTLLPRPPAR